MAVQAGVAEVRRRAAAFDGPVVDLSIGAPVDPSPAVAQRALAHEADAPGYPLTVGRPDLRQAYANWLDRAHGVPPVPLEAVLPVIGLKELIGSLALHLELGPDDVVGLPSLAYPTYAVGAALVRAHTVLVEGPDDLAGLQAPPALLWVNSPANPTGRVLGVEALRRMVAWCREHGTLLVSDECYLDLGWEATPVSVLHPDVSGGSHDGVLAIHSLSKRSNLAGYRCAFVAGDAALVTELASVRRNLGLGMPSPQQGVAMAVLRDDEHVEKQRARYAARRAVLRPALEAAGFRVDHSEAGLYLWATRGERGADTVAALADRGLIVVDGAEYGVAGEQHVRLALTVADDDAEIAASRLRSLTP